MPNLRFELVQTLVGAHSVALYYRGARGMVVETLFFDVDGLVKSAAAHYE
jgi:hypothetical protein